jgi:phosphotransferase system enzyme I (PtsI)
VVPSGAQVLLDGHHGRLIVHPTEDTLAFYRERQRRYEELLQSDRELVPLPSETKDGYPVTLQANIEFKQELDLVDQYGAEGIGLVRTEMLFLMRRNVSLSEDEQLTCYREFIDAVAPAPVTFRLLDFGGDKMLPLAHREHNPFLGWRGMRVLLDRPELLRPQVRALLRAGADGPARILLPMITHLDEVHAFYEVLENVRAELEREGIPYDPDPPVGIMVEVPAVALQADLFAQAVDFFSIGTNDLTQYVLAVDRGNDRVAHRYDEFHPAVLQLIRRSIQAAAQEDIPVSLCGKMGANPKAAPLLIGLGLDTISASPSFLPPVKRVIRAVRRAPALDLAEATLLAPGPDAVHQQVDAWFEEYAPEALAMEHPQAPSEAT